MRVGFGFHLSDGGPSVFMRRLREEFRSRQEITTTMYFDPRADLLLVANKVRNPWRKPFVFRMDGIVFDSALPLSEISKRNSDYLRGLAGASGIVFQSKFDQELVTTHIGAPSVPTTIIPNGINLVRAEIAKPNARRLLGIPEDRLVFVTSAKWRIHKRLDATIDAFNLFRREYANDAHLIVIGDLSCVDHPRVTPNVHYVGHVPPSALLQWYAAGDIFLFFSWLDHCPNTVVEAIGSGLPVICTNQGGTRELVEGCTAGLVVDVDDEYGFDRVRLYEPPQPNLASLTEGMIAVASDLELYKSKINPSLIDISNTARRYQHFLESLYKQ